MSQLVFDQSIKMPATNGWAKGDGAGPLELHGLGHSGEETEANHDSVGDTRDLELQEREPRSYVRIQVRGH